MSGNRIVDAESVTAP